jgi:serine/threonine-protein kinase
MNGSSVFLIAFFTSILTATGTVYLIERLHLLEPPREQVELAEVPDLKGLSEMDARENLKAQKLSLLVKSRVPSGEGKPGTVIGQSVVPGQKVPAGHPVAVTIADALPKVPSVVGLSVEEATAQLEKQGFRIKVGDKIADATIAEGKIIAQTPQADGVLEKDGAVLVQVSLGPADVEVPKVVGKSLTAAKEDLEKAGLKLAPVRWVSIAETATFVVLSQKPEPGKPVKPGTEIQLSANR